MRYAARVNTLLAAASLALALAPPTARAGDGVFDAQVILNHDARRGMTEMVREFTLCFDPKGKGRKFDVEVKIEAGELHPDPDVVTVDSNGKAESKQKVTWECVPQGPNKDEKGDACFRMRHRLTVPMGGLKPGTKVTLWVKVLQLKKKKAKGTQQAEMVVRATMGG